MHEWNLNKKNIYNDKESQTSINYIYIQLWFPDGLVIKHK